MVKLSKRQTDQIITLVKKGADLPVDCKHLLYTPERREYELVYGENEREEDVLEETMGVPLQPNKDSAMKDKSAWNNMIIFADNLQIMKTLLQTKEKLSLINSDGSIGIKNFSTPYLLLEGNSVENMMNERIRRKSQDNILLTTYESGLFYITNY